MRFFFIGKTADNIKHYDDAEIMNRIGKSDQAAAELTGKRLKVSEYEECSEDFGSFTKELLGCDYL